MKSLVGEAIDKRAQVKCSLFYYVAVGLTCLAWTDRLCQIMVLLLPGPFLSFAIDRLSGVRVTFRLNPSQKQLQSGLFGRLILTPDRGWNISFTMNHWSNGKLINHLSFLYHP